MIRLSVNQMDPGILFLTGPVQFTAGAAIRSAPRSVIVRASLSLADTGAPLRRANQRLLAVIADADLTPLRNIPNERRFVNFDDRQHF